MARGRSSDAVAADDYRCWYAHRGGGLILCLVVLLFLTGVYLPFWDKEGREEGEWREGGSKIVNQKDQTKISLHACYSLFRKCKLYTVKVIQPMEH